MSEAQLKQVVFPVAGLGSRFLPVTKSIPKEMLPIIDKPLIQFAVEEAIQAGAEEIIFVTSHTKTAIEDYFSKNYELETRLRDSNKSELIQTIYPDYLKNIKFSFVRQNEPNGLGHAILQAKNLITEDFFGIVLADDLILSDVGCLKQLKDIHSKTNSSVLGVFSAPDSELKNYGVIDATQENDMLKLNSIIEKPSINEAPSNLAVFGRYILSKSIFNILEETKPGLNGEIQLTDAIRSFLSNDSVFAFEFQGRRFDCGSKEGYVSAIVDRASHLENFREIVKK
jgi:UTP--glucose-1-phosphate uridylyltransferase